jgi:hypothetical protein
MTADICQVIIESGEWIVFWSARNYPLSFFSALLRGGKEAFYFAGRMRFKCHAIRFPLPFHLFCSAI